MINLKSKNVENLIKAILLLDDEQEAKAFLRDLLTEREIIEFSNRWKTARMLDDSISYSKIQKETGLSARTIARISEWLKNGKGGYKLMIKKFNHHHNSNPDGKELC